MNCLASLSLKIIVPPGASADGLRVVWHVWLYIRASQSDKPNYGEKRLHHPTDGYCRSIVYVLKIVVNEINKGMVST